VASSFTVPEVDASPSGTRPTNIRPLGLVGAFLRRDWGIAWSYRLPFFLTLVQSLVTLWFVFFLGRLVGHKVSAVTSGPQVSYFAFAVLGTTLLSLLNVSLTSVAHQLRNDQTTGTLEILFTMPLPAWVTVLAGVSYKLVYAIATAVVTVLIAVAAFGMRFHTSPAGVLVAVVVLSSTIGLFCAAGLVFAAFVVVFKRGEVMTGLAATALSLLGGVYYPVGLLPGPLRELARILPFTWALDVLRGALLANTFASGQFVLLCVFTVAALPVAVAIFDRALDQARRRATLAQY